MATFLNNHLLTFHHALKHTIKQTLNLFAYLLRKILTTIGLSFAYAVNAFFFTLMFILLDVPGLIFAFLSFSTVSGRECEHCIWIGEAGCKGRKCGGGEVEGGELDESNGLERRCKICWTDEISELDLDDNKQDEDEDEDERELLDERQRKRLERVRDWAVRLESEGEDENGVGEKIVGDYFSLPIIGEDQNSSACSVEDTE